MSLWRTSRPLFPLYPPDGKGRDKYIIYNNGGAWNNIGAGSLKHDYERPKYKNFHSLFHLAAPFKYHAEGNGREAYIIGSNGLTRDTKALSQYKLSDFLRGGDAINSPQFSQRKSYFSKAEKKYNKQLKKIESKLITRLYSEPLLKIKEKKGKYCETEAKEGKIERNYKGMLSERLPVINSGGVNPKSKLLHLKLQSMDNINNIILNSHKINNYEGEKLNTISNFSSFKREKYDGNRHKNEFRKFLISHDVEYKTSGKNYLSGKRIFTERKRK